MQQLLINDEVYTDDDGNEMTFDKIAKNSEGIYCYIGKRCIVSFKGINEDAFETSDGKWYTEPTIEEEINDINEAILSLMEVI